MTARFKDLTKEDLTHLAEYGIETLQEFTEVAARQKELRDRVYTCEPCQECRAIAKKLGLPV